MFDIYMLIGTVLLGMGILGILIWTDYQHVPLTTFALVCLLWLAVSVTWPFSLPLILVIWIFTTIRNALNNDSKSPYSRKKRD